MENSDKQARIEAIVTDQGNGSSYCSLCGQNLDYGDPRKCPNIGERCPKCNAIFIGHGEPYINWGGSDY